MEPVSETDQEQVPEDLGKLTVADKARTGRVSFKAAFLFAINGVELEISGKLHLNITLDHVTTCL